MSNEIDEIIDDVASGPKSVSGDEGSVNQHSIPDLIELAKFKAQQSATSNGVPKISICRMTTPGSV
ncbi:MAG: hypothetical protein WCY59_09500 [Anaerovoracaceae bacterium]